MYIICDRILNELKPQRFIDLILFGLYACNKHITQVLRLGVYRSNKYTHIICILIDTSCKTTRLQHNHPLCLILQYNIHRIAQVYIKYTVLKCCGSIFGFILGELPVCCPFPFIKSILKYTGTLSAHPFDGIWRVPISHWYFFFLRKSIHEFHSFPLSISLFLSRKNQIHPKI